MYCQRFVIFLFAICTLVSVQSSKESRVQQIYDSNLATTTATQQSYLSTTTNDGQYHCFDHCQYRCRFLNTECQCFPTDCSKIYQCPGQTQVVNGTNCLCVPLPQGYYCPNDGSGYTEDYILLVAILCIGSFMLFGCLLCMLAARHNRYARDSRSLFRRPPYTNNRNRTSRAEPRSTTEVSIITEPPLPKYEDYSNYPQLPGSFPGNGNLDNDAAPPTYEDVTSMVASNVQPTSSNATNHAGVGYVNDAFTV